MDYYLITLSLFAIFATLLLNLKLGKTKLPPGPKSWPIIGNIHLLGDKPHRSLAKLANKYGPIMSLKLGTVTTIVISSSKVAKEMFLNHDLALSSRKVPDAIRATNHDQHSVIWLPVGPKWRSLRKILMIELLTNQRLDASQGIRQKKVNDLVEHARMCCEKGLPVNIGKAGFTTSLNLLSNTLFSIDLASHDTLYSQEFKDLVTRIMEEVAIPNISDFFPILRHFDLQGTRRRNTGHFEKLLEIFDKIIDQRVKNGRVGEQQDVLDRLLELVDDNELSLDDVKHMFMDIFVAGTDTTSVTFEWAMTELLRNPEKMAKAQIEIDQVVGKNNGPVQESHISKLPYIQAVVKETMRLRLIGPFLIPHKAEEDVELCGYIVPKNAQILVNTCSIDHDPNVWPDALSFSPERFLESEIDTKGRHFELTPFGSGRRICPGMSLANRMVHLMLATLIHSYDWKHANGLNPQDIDVDEKFGLTLQKIHPLQLIPLIRSHD